MTRTQVALLRGINVGTAKRVAMADLAAVVREQGYDDVVTLLRSGNVAFSAPTAALPVRAAADLEAALLQRCGVQSSFVLVRAADLAAALAADPLAAVAVDPSRELLSFSDRDLAAGLAAPSDEQIAPDVVRLGERVVYSWHPDGISKSRVAPSWWRSLGGVVTARNRTTCERLLALTRG